MSVAPAATMLRPRVVVIGGGFAGLNCAKALRGADCETLLIDRRNHHTFQPLLYQVATAALAPSEVGYPIRRIFRRDRRVTVVMGEAVAFDLDRRCVRVAMEPDGEIDVPYDALVVAAGAESSYFGHPAWSLAAPSLKSLEDAIQIRGRILAAFERAETCDDDVERRRLLTFVIVGAGPTGVELAGAIKELAVDAIAKDFRRVDTTTARVILLEGGDRVLPAMHPTLSAQAQRTLERLGAEVRLRAMVTEIDARGVTIGGGSAQGSAGERLNAANVLWAAGVRASALGAKLGTATDATGRVRVEPDLSLPGRPEVFVIGDLARVEQSDGALVPGVAPAAMQMGRFVGRRLRQRFAGRESVDRFIYRDKGSLATIGRSAAVAEVAGLRFKGVLAWFLWSAVHVTYLIGFRNRAVTLLSWFLSYLFFTKGSRLITEPAPPRASVR